MILRELNGDIYFGEPRGIARMPTGERVGINTMRYSEPEIERIAHVGFQTARDAPQESSARSTRPTCSRPWQLWREVVIEVGREYPDVELTHLYRRRRRR